MLCHGDHIPDHWSIDENFNIIGIIDFGDMQGDPINTDFAISEKREPQLDISIVKML